MARLSSSPWRRFLLIFAIAPTIRLPLLAVHSLAAWSCAPPPPNQPNAMDPTGR